MNKLRAIGIVCTLTAGLSLSGIASAQDLTAGKFSGGYVTDGPARQYIGMTLVISNVTGETVKGSAAVMGGNCRGQYGMEGTVNGAALVLKSTNGPNIPGCTLDLSGKVEGGVISTSVDSKSFQLTK